MPIQNDNVIISPNDFLENNKKGEFYTGYVFGLGYAFVQHFPVEVFSGTDCYHPIIDIQCIDQSEECIQEGFDIVVERLKRKILKIDMVGRYYVIYQGKQLFLPSPDSLKLNIKFEGQEAVVDVEILSIRYADELNKTIERINFKGSLKNFGFEFSINIAEIIWASSAALGVVETALGPLNEMFNIEKNFYDKYLNNPYPNRAAKAKKFSESIFQSLKRNGINTFSNELNDKIIPKTLKTIKRGLWRANLALTAFDVYNSHQLKVSHLFNIFMLTSAFPTSWVLGGVIIGADILLYATTDKSLGDWIDHYAGKIGLGDENGVVFGEDKIHYYQMQKHYDDDFIIVPDNTRVVKPMIDIFYEKVY
ncbi:MULTISPECIES: hypothetical protein [Bacteroidaceae]|jgi:hypothetical protein|uniref:Uncharacterized protein n=1 Tax=Bacteroides uniformis TaxID=820 RepID=A0A414W6Z6_BACUN|nr:MULTISPECIES: hypothetical protein [Bacteroidaceae]RGJ33781.1 hypothetical protein DXD64_20155 [Phocaeicola vulgatus]RHH25923.1 hypothetical protein DW216_20205 [Bacteroides uniformis]